MKKMIAALLPVLALSSMASACPDLQGQYLCKTFVAIKTFKVNLNVQQATDANGVSAFQVDGADILANGQELPVSSLPKLVQVKQVQSATYIAACKDESSLQFAAKGIIDGRYGTLNSELTKLPNGEVQINVGYQSGRTNSHHKATCTKIGG